MELGLFWLPVLSPPHGGISEQCSRRSYRSRPKPLSTRISPYDPRVTRVGRFLLETSLDELPQFWNVLKGEMSLVGPRPIVEAEIPRYGSMYQLYKRVRPGISGIWQVGGLCDTGYAERVALDAYYVRNWSVWLDLVILARTIATVASRRGAR